jgi:superfamily II DNA or RNA helicase
MMNRTRKNQQGGSYKNNEQSAGSKEVITEEEMEQAKLMPPIEKDFFELDLKMKPGGNADEWHLKHKEKYFAKKMGGVEKNTAPQLFVYDGYVFKKNRVQTNQSHLKYTRKILNDRELKISIKEDLSKTEKEELNKEIQNVSELEDDLIEKIQQDVEKEMKDAEEDIEKEIKVPIKEEIKVPIKENKKRSSEDAEFEYIKKNPESKFSISPSISESDDFLYPTVNDPYFSHKIANRTEFASYKYDGKKVGIKELADKLCANPDFELMPHQLFVKNFISKNTPYNSILLYHGLGSGKTCSAIGIAEDMRATMSQTSMKKQIMLVASTNVQDNFRLQLFDERKLKRALDGNGSWTIEAGSCIGNSLLKEINPMNDVGITAEKIISQANAIINNSYEFMGYTQLANQINKYSLSSDEDVKIANIKKNFNFRMIVIDEVHNVPNSMLAPLLEDVARHAEGVKFVLLSATPMYNSVDEIIWLCNLMNINDGRAKISYSDVFDKTGEFKESGEKLLRRKLNGYVSYVRGENPYTFPFRLYPETFEEGDKSSTFLNNKFTYPKKSITSRPNVPVLKDVMKNRVYLTQIGKEQEKAYNFITSKIFTRHNNGNIFASAKPDDDEDVFENMESYGYTKLQIPLQSLIITYPSTKKFNSMDKSDWGDLSKEEAKEMMKDMVGKSGINRIMDYTEVIPKADDDNQIYMKYKYKYKTGFEGFFTIDKANPASKTLDKHSSKITRICEKILESKGIVMVYTQFIDGGIVPMALALEELGFTRYGTNSKPMFAKGAAINQEPRDAITMELGTKTKQAKYMILSGDKFFSHNNAEDIKYATSEANKNGHDVKVILISRAASEGLDFKNIRQIHILDPWYNLNRIEQIVGRGVRNMSHCKLPFEDRNVEIYLHATVLETGEEECADQYVYRYAESKAIRIGKVTKLLKEVSVDCVLNIGQKNFTDAELFKIAENKKIEIQPSSLNKIVSFRVGDKPGTEACDYDKCNYTCRIDKEMDLTTMPFKEVKDTHNLEVMKSNANYLMDKIKNLYRTEKKSFHKDEFKKLLSVNSDDHDLLFYVLTKLVDGNETVEDSFGREGRVTNRGEYYVFQPIEVSDSRSNLFENMMPINFRHSRLKYKISDKINKDAPLEAAMDPSSPMSPTAERLANADYQSVKKELEESMKMVQNPAHKYNEREKDWSKNLNSKLLSSSTTLIEKYLFPFFEGDDAKKREQIEKYAFAHLMDALNYRQKKILIEKVYNPHQELDDLEIWIKMYFDDLRFTNESTGSIGILMTKVTKGIVSNIVYKRDKGEWTEEDPTDVFDLRDQIEKTMKKLNLGRLSDPMGFMGYFASTLSMVFKTKKLEQKKGVAKGSYLIKEGKGMILKIYNEIMRSVGKDEMGDTPEDVTKIGFAIVVEIIMRHFNAQSMAGKIWYLPSEYMVEYGLAK